MKDIHQYYAIKYPCGAYHGGGYKINKQLSLNCIKYYDGIIVVKSTIAALRKQGVDGLTYKKAAIGLVGYDENIKQRNIWEHGGWS